MRCECLLKSVPFLVAPARAQGSARARRFVPQANFSSLDPVWTRDGVDQLVHAKLYGINRVGDCKPQCATQMKFRMMT